MIKYCPFCGGVDIKFSQKTCSTRRDEHKYYVAMYCRNCNCYGARAIVEISREDFDRFGYQCVEDKFRDVAIRNWNRRAKGIGVEYEQK